MPQSNVSQRHDEYDAQQQEEQNGSHSSAFKKDPSIKNESVIDSFTDKMNKA